MFPVKSLSTVTTILVFLNFLENSLWKNINRHARARYPVSVFILLSAKYSKVLVYCQGASSLDLKINFALDFIK